MSDLHIAIPWFMHPWPPLKAPEDLWNRLLQETDDHPNKIPRGSSGSEDHDQAKLN